MQLPSANHIRLTKLPSSTGFWRTPLIRGNKLLTISRGGAGSVALGALGLADTLNIFFRQEDTSFWNRFLRPSFWAFLSFGTYFSTTPPANVFQTDLINNGVKNIVDNIIEKLSDKDSFVQLLSDKSIRNLNKALTTMLEKACTVISKHYDKLKTNTNLNEQLFWTDILREREPLLFRLYESVFDESKVELEERPAKLRELLRVEGGTFLHKLSSQERDLERELIAEIFAPEKDSSGNELENTELATIRNEINKVLEPLGMTLLFIQPDKPNDEIKLFFVNLKGYSVDNNKTDAPLDLPGMLVSLNPGNFFNVTRNIVENLNELYRDENVREVLRGTNVSKDKIEIANKAILSHLGPWIPELSRYNSARAIHVTYDPKVTDPKMSPYVYVTLDPIMNLLNETSFDPIRKLRDIIGTGTSGIIGSMGLKEQGVSNTNHSDNSEREGDVPVYASGEPRSSLGGAPLYEDLNDNKESKKVDGKTKKQNENFRHRMKILTDITGVEKGLGITLDNGDDTNLPELKLLLLALQLRYLNNKVGDHEKSKTLIKNIFFDKHKTEIEAERNKIVEEIRGRKDHIMSRDEIENEINSRLEKYKNDLYESKFEKERSSGHLKTNTGDIDSVELPNDKKEEFWEEYVDMAETVSQALSELMPSSKFLGEEQQLKLRGAGELVRKYGVRDILVLALEGSLARNNGNAKVEFNGKNILIDFGDGTKKSINNDTELFYELARSTPGKTTTQAVLYVEHLLRVLDKDHGKALGAQIAGLRDAVLESSKDEREITLAAYGDKMPKDSPDGVVNK